MHRVCNIHQKFSSSHFLTWLLKKGQARPASKYHFFPSLVLTWSFLYFRLWCPFLSWVESTFYFLKRIETGGAGVDIYFFTSGFVIPLLLIPFFFGWCQWMVEFVFFFAPPGVSRGCLRKIRRFRWLRFHLIYRHHTDGWLLILFSKWPYIHLETCGCCSTNVLIWIYF